MEENTDNLDNQTVFTKTNAEISRTAVTQCKKHKWEKLAENELYCPVCESAIITNNINKWLTSD
jgi:Zn finger protein HypA/HybF involved in hydrogenase expression